MPTTDNDPLGEGLKWRLRAELNRVQPPYSSPRYMAPARHRVAVWRIAPAALAAAVVGMIGLTAYAATGSPNPAVWTQRIVNRIGPNAAPESTASPSQSPVQSPHAAVPAPPTHEAEPTQAPEPSEQPESSPSPSPGHDSGSGDGDQHPDPSPTPTHSPDGGDH